MLGRWKLIPIALACVLLCRCDRTSPVNPPSAPTTGPTTRFVLYHLLHHWDDYGTLDKQVTFDSPNLQKWLTDHELTLVCLDLTAKGGDDPLCKTYRIKLPPATVMVDQRSGQFIAREGLFGDEHAVITWATESRAALAARAGEASPSSTQPIPPPSNPAP